MKRRMFLCVMAGITLLPSVALTHGPTRQKVTETVDVAAAPEEVWAYIGNFQDMSWHPAIATTEGEGENEVDATRILTLKGEDGEANPDATISEVLSKYDAEKMTYSYRIEAVDVAVLPVTNYSSHLTVKPKDDGGSTIEWRGAFYRGDPLNDPPPELNDEAALAAVTGVYRAGLDALAEHFSQ